MEQVELYVGKKAEVNKGLLKLNYPIEHGIVKDWGDMESLWNYTYGEMKVSQLEHPVLLTEAILNPCHNRERMAEIFFETYTAPAVFICSQALLPLYASGNTTGVVLDCGDGVCQCAPVYEGFILNNTAQRIDIGGRDVTQRLNFLLRRAGHVFSTSGEMELVKALKEKMCMVVQTPGGIDREMKENKGASKGMCNPVKYALPDSTEILVGEEKCLAPEILFYPDKIGKEFMGIHEMLVSSINKADIDLKTTLYQTINIAGAGSKFPGLATRILNELKDKKLDNVKVRRGVRSRSAYMRRTIGSSRAGLAGPY